VAQALLRSANSVSLRAARQAPALGPVASRGRAQHCGKSVRVAEGGKFRGLGLRVGGGLPTKRSFHATPAAMQGGRMYSERSVHFGVVVVPQQMAYVVERFGKFHSVLEPGLNLLIPVVDRIAYAHSLKEEALTIPNQMAITADNVTLQIDGVLYARIIDPFKASYGVSDALFAVMQLAQTTMRSQIGMMSLDQTFKDRVGLNENIVKGIEEASVDWGVKPLRYEIRDIVAPAKIKQAMDQQAEAERRKRAQILDSEAEQLSDINIAEGRKQAQVLASEGRYTERINEAKAEAESIAAIAAATAQSIRTVAEAMQCRGGAEAVQLQV
jgi:regulator of protease activity HflC (stomatin/prohibitin superfamily)